MFFPIIMLHHVLDKPHESIAEWSITPHKFTEMLDCIDEAGLKITTFEEIIATKKSAKDLKDSVVITFDDCPTSLFDFAIPELVRRKAKAVFYMPTAYIGKYNMWDVEDHGAVKTPVMNEDDMLKLVNLGMEIGSHSNHHIKLSAISEAKGFEEISKSKEILEGIIEKPVYSIAYPYGEIPRKFKVSLKNAGYRFGLSIYPPSQHLYSLRRIGIYQNDTRKSMLFKLSRSYHLLRDIASPIKRVKNIVTKKGR